MLRKIEVERFSVTSSKPFEKVLVAISKAVGHPEMAEFWKSTHTAESVAELERAVKPVLGRTGFMQFVVFDLDNKVETLCAERQVKCPCRSDIRKNKALQVRRTR